jgi:phage terminase small subunit
MEERGLTIVPKSAAEDAPKGEVVALTPKEELFITKYLGEAHFNGAKAARLAGYSEDSARQIAYEMLRKSHVRVQVDACLAAEAMTKEEILAALKLIASAPTSHFMQVVQAEYVDEAGVFHQAIIRQDYSAKVRALELLAKAHGMLTEKIQVEAFVPKRILLTQEEYDAI